MRLINGYEHYYIDKCGNVYSDKSGEIIKLSPYILHNGYMSIRLLNKGKRKGHLIHRLVAMAYIPNELNLPEVNHIDGNRLNNNVDNLEWIGRKENIQHSITKLGNSPIRFFKKCELYKGDDLIGTFKSIMEASRVAYDKFGVSISSLRKYKKAKDVTIKVVECEN